MRMRAAGRRGERAGRRIARANAEAARDPDQVLATLTRNNATFSERDLDRHLAKHIADLAEREAVKGRVLGHDEVLALYDRETGEAAGRYTTKTVRAQERQALADAAEVRRPRERAGSAHGRRPRRWRLGRCGRSARRVRPCGRAGRAEDHRGPGRDGEELHARRDPRGARARAGRG